MKQIRFLGIIVCLFFATILFSSNTAYALEIDRPVDTKDTINTETFMCYEEFLQFFNLSGNSNFNLKNKFKPYHSKILKNRFYDKIYRIEGETFEYHDFVFGKIELPVYTIGQIYIPFEKLPSQTRGDLLNGFRSELWLQFGFAIGQEENFNYDSIIGRTKLKDGYTYIIVLLEGKNGSWNPASDIGIVIKTKTNLYYDTLDYTYPTEAEYLAMYSNTKPKVTATPTPKPTATPVPTATPTPEPTATPVPTATPTPEPTATPVPTPEPTATPVPTATPTPEPSATPEPTATPTPKLTQTPVQSDTESNNLGIIVSISSIVALIVVILVVVFFRNKKK